MKDRFSQIRFVVELSFRIILSSLFSITILIVIWTTSNPKRRTRNAEHGTQNVEPGTLNTERRTRNTEHGTRNAEHGTRNAELFKLFKLQTLQTLQTPHFTLPPQTHTFL